MSGWEGARQNPVKHCLRFQRPGLRGEVAGGTSMCAKGSRSRARPSELSPFGARGKQVVLLLRAVMKYEGWSYPIRANESCVPACPALCLVICISNQPRESVLRQGQKAFRDIPWN